MSGLHHPSACDSVVLLLKILSASLYSMYLKVNPADTSMCMYIQFAHAISSFFKFFFQVSSIFFSKFCKVYKFFASIRKNIVSGLRHPSTCDSVMLLLKNLSASLYSMYLNVNPAYTFMCMYTNLPW